MIGQKLKNRYEILRRIGGGGMAVVYLALDHLLHRQVAIKILRQQYVNDEEFIHRFRREAQSAASLSHPNVVSIYDVGQEDETYFIVMEYVEGTTLNQIIHEHAPLNIELAVYYATEIALGLQHAHQKGIIHRDIKPHNILVGKDGQVKVTDFGIARAITSSSITQTDSVLGSVNYLSPEHAKGTIISERSDIYSLGVVLYEMLTGKLPFTGDTPISIAVKHLQDQVEAPHIFNPNIPQTVENIILTSMRKVPSDRYQTVKSMLDDLQNFVDKTNKPQSPKISRESYKIDELEQTKRLVMSSMRKQLQASEQLQIVLDETKEVDYIQKRTKYKWIRPLSWLSILLIFVFLIWTGIQSIKSQFQNTEIEVPDVLNFPLSEAQSKLNDLNLNSTIIYEESTAKKDTVIRQSPTKMKVLKGTKIQLFVSKGKKAYIMEDYISKNLKDVMLVLVDGLGILKDNIKVNYLYTDDAPDTILKQSPQAYDEFDPLNIQVVLTVSKGRESFKMPDLSGLTEAEARAQIELLDLTLKNDGIIREKSYKYPKGRVISQSPYLYNDDVSPKSEIRIVISDGLPVDAGIINVSFPIQPSVNGQSSTFTIIVSDAQYQNFVYRTETISEQKTIDVRLIVSSDANAVISIKENDVLINTITKTYQDFLDSKKTSMRNSQNSYVNRGYS